LINSVLHGSLPLTFLDAFNNRLLVFLDPFVALWCLGAPFLGILVGLDLARSDWLSEDLDGLFLLSIAFVLRNENRGV
jgi:hypothetical protein